MPRITIAGARKTAPTTYLPSRPWSAEGVGAAVTGGSAVMLPPAKRLLPLLVRLRRRGLQLAGDAVHVLRVLEEVLEQSPLALAGGAAERRGLRVRHVEHDRLRLRERDLGRARDRIRIHARAHVVVPGPEAAGLRPCGRCLRRREELDERPDGRCVLEGDDRVG